MTETNGNLLGVSRSLKGRRWQASDVDETARQALRQTHGVSDILSRILAARGVRAEDCGAFLKPALRDALPDPSRLAGMDQAAEILRQAIETRQPVAIFGDYDADGITSSAMLTNYLRLLGVPTEVHLPDRMKEGYGVNLSALRALREKGCRLVITVDCGVSDGEILARAAEEGSRIVVLDHHPAEAPPDGIAALVNPNCPPDESGLGYLSAAGLVFLFLAAVNRLLRASMTPPDLVQFLDLAALGTVCDVSPLVGLNRALVVRGLAALSRGRHRGLAALIRAAGGIRTLDAQTFSFLLGPRINAAGRMGHASLALALLMSETDAEADARAAELETLNKQRRALEQAMTEQAAARVNARYDGRNKTPSFLLVASDDWHVGVLGIVAARLRDRYDRPSAVVALGADGVGVGSARAPDGVHLGRLMARAREKGLLIRGGGHAAAAGFTVEASRIEALEAFLQEEASAHGETDEAPPLIVDAILRAEGATRDLFDQIQKAGPFGKGNPEPCLALADMRLAYWEKKAGGHLRCRFESSSGASFSAIAFRAADGAMAKAFAKNRQELFHLAGSLRPGWHGGMELTLEDAALSRDCVSARAA